MNKTTTTADKGELLPLPNSVGQRSKLVFEDGYWEWKFSDVIGLLRNGENLYTADQMREYALANMNRRPTNEGQDGLTDSEILTDAHRYCCKYVHADDAPYRFTERGIIEFVRLRIERALNQRLAVKDHTAEAVRELVEGLKQARETINLLWLSHHANRSDAAIEACDALLAKYAPSQEVKDGG